MESVIQTDANKPPSTNDPEWLLLAKRFGLGALFAAYLLYNMVGVQQKALGNIEAMLHAQQVQVADVAKVTKDTAAVSAASSLRTEAYLRLLCVSSAKTTADRNSCLTVR